MEKSTESQMKALFQRFVKDESGVTAIEYGLIAGLISVVILVAVTAIGTSLQGLFQTIATASARSGKRAGPGFRYASDNNGQWLSAAQMKEMAGD